MNRLSLLILIAIGFVVHRTDPASGQEERNAGKTIEITKHSVGKHSVGKHSVKTTESTSTKSRPRPDPVSITDLPPRPRPKTKQKLEFEKRGGIVYRKTDDYQLKCDLYIPDGEGPFPAILAVHGGAWRHGSKFALLRHAWRMAESGYVVVAINYRHAPQYPFPAQVHDCKHAVRWIRANATQYKIDPDRIGGFGYSAGGHLVSMLGTTDVDDGLEGEIASGMEGIDTRLQCVAAGGAPCEFSWIDADARTLSYWLGGSPKQQSDTFSAASPTTYITPDDPPFFFFHGDADLIVPVDASRKMHDLLVKSQVQSQHFVARRNGHIGTFSDLNWMDKAIEFFDAKLK